MTVKIICINLVNNTIESLSMYLSISRSRYLKMGTAYIDDRV